MTVADLVRANPSRTFSISWYWVSVCEKCKKKFFELDKEYSPDINIENLDYYIEQYEHIPNIELDDCDVCVDGDIITVKEFNPDSFVCDECTEVML